MNKKSSSGGSAEETRPIPSKAEGDDAATNDAVTRPVPSQAEGDERTVEESLRQKERKQ